MWKVPIKCDMTKQKDDCFNDMMEECRIARPTTSFSYGLRMRMERFLLATRMEIVNRLKAECSPLFMACRKGHLEMVDYLLNVCNADVNLRGVYEVPDER